jgi:hypothetical protein
MTKGPPSRDVCSLPLINSADRVLVARLNFPSELSP